MPRTSTGSSSRPGRGFVTGAAVVAVLVVAGVAVSLGAAFGAHPTKAAAPASPAAGPVAGGSTCGLTGLDRTDATLTIAPPTRWTTVGTMAAPSSATAGPGRQQSDGLRSCYAHTVTGALFAVANFWATGSDPRLYRQIVETNVADGPGRDTALRASGAPSNTGTSAQIAGFKVDSYRPNAATVDVALQSSSGQQIGFPVPVVWQDGDWKVQVADDGTNVFRPTILSSLAGYVPWAGAE
ncbi:hypothetical protein [Amnibacterium endophyticum]|uniref:DUF8175 domain-containing protein n=1 Tax=Amnibacterium endophyticum TaxID=2109337 RepID=A0ABW4LI06_9MICO